MLVIADVELVLPPSCTWSYRAWLLQGMGSVALGPRLWWCCSLGIPLCSSPWGDIAGGWCRWEGPERPEKQQQGWWWAAMAAAGWEQPGGLEMQCQTAGC